MRRFTIQSQTVRQALTIRHLTTVITEARLRNISGPHRWIPAPALHNTIRQGEKINQLCWKRAKWSTRNLLTNQSHRRTGSERLTQFYCTSGKCARHHNQLKSAARGFLLLIEINNLCTRTFHGQWNPKLLWHCGLKSRKLPHSDVFFKYIPSSIAEYFSLCTLWLCYFLVRLLNNIWFVGSQVS